MPEKKSSPGQEDQFSRKKKKVDAGVSFPAFKEVTPVEGGMILDDVSHLETTKQEDNTAVHQGQDLKGKMHIFDATEIHAQLAEIDRQKEEKRKLSEADELGPVQVLQYFDEQPYPDDAAQPHSSDLLSSLEEEGSEFLLEEFLLDSNPRFENFVIDAAEGNLPVNAHRDFVSKAVEPALIWTPGEAAQMIQEAHETGQHPSHNLDKKTIEPSHEAVDFRSNTMGILEWEGVEAGLEYQGKNILTAEDRLVGRFIDMGSGSLFDIETNELSEYRENVVVDPLRDEKLAEIVNEAQETFLDCTDCSDHQAVQRVAEYAFKLVDHEHSLKNSEALPVGKDIYLSDIVAKEAAVCRHRTLLFKTLIDHLPQEATENISVAVVRGAIEDSVTGKMGGHAWNHLRIGKKIYLVDLMNPPHALGETDEKMFPFPEITQQTPSSYHFFHEKTDGKSSARKSGVVVSGEWINVGQFLGHQDMLREFEGYTLEGDFENYSVEDSSLSIAEIEGMNPDYTKGGLPRDAQDVLLAHAAELEFLDNDDMLAILEQEFDKGKWGEMFQSNPEMKGRVFKDFAAHGLRLFNEMKANDGAIIVYARLEGGVIIPQDRDSFGKLHRIKQYSADNNGASVHIRLADISA